MTRRGHAAGRRPALAILAGVALLAAAGAAAAAASADAPRAAGTGFLVFVSAPSRIVLPDDLVEVRREAEDACAAALARRWPAVRPAAELAPLQERWRVRDGRILKRGFLAALAGEAGVGRLIVVDLFFHERRLVAAARSLAAATGLVTGACVVETGWAEDSAWRAAVAGIATELVATLGRPRTPAAEPVLALLPVQSLGIDRRDAILATNSLLEVLLRESAGSPLDPALLAGSVIGAGDDPGAPGTAALRTLGETFGVRRVVIPQLLSYRPEIRSSLASAEDEEPTAPAPFILPAFALQLREVDVETGTVVTSAGAYRDGRPERGWFGVQRSPAPRRLLADAAREAWRNFVKIREES